MQIVVVEGKETIIGDDLHGNDNYGKPRQEYADKVLAMTLDELKQETSSKLWLSAYASNNRRSDYHWHVSVCYAMCEHRQPGLYSKLYDVALAS